MEIINLNSLATNKVTSYMDNNIAVITDIADVRDMHTEDCLLEGYMFAILIKGTAQTIVDDKLYNLHEGDIFACLPHNILEKSMFSMDIEVCGMYITPEFAEEIANLINLDWTFRMMVQSHEIMHVSGPVIKHIKDYFALVQDKISNDNTPNKHNSIKFLIASMVYELFDVREQMTGETIPTFQHTSSENIFKNFVKLLEDRSQPFRNVNGYAEALNISPKYFSSICKQVSGKTASEIINEEILRIAQAMLHDNSMSIKQIADRLGFANQSHFGSFFRRHTGTSPHHYRESL